MRVASLILGLTSLLGLADALPTVQAKNKLPLIPTNLEVSQLDPVDTNTDLYDEKYQIKPTVPIREPLVEAMAAVSIAALEEQRKNAFKRALEDFIVEARRASNLARRDGGFFGADKSIRDYADDLYEAQHGSEAFAALKAAGKSTLKFGERDTSTSDSDTSSSASSDHGRGYKHPAVPPPKPIQPVKKPGKKPGKKPHKPHKKPGKKPHKKPGKKPVNKPTKESEKFPQEAVTVFRVGPVLPTVVKRNAPPAATSTTATTASGTSGAVTSTQNTSQTATTTAVNGTSPTPSRATPPFSIPTGLLPTVTKTIIVTQTPISRPTKSHTHKPTKSPAPLELPNLFPYPSPQPFPEIKHENTKPGQNIKITINEDGDVKYDNQKDEGSSDKSEKTSEGSEVEEANEWAKEHTKYHSNWNKDGEWDFSDDEEPQHYQPKKPVKQEDKDDAWFEGGKDKKPVKQEDKDDAWLQNGKKPYNNEDKDDFWSGGEW